MTTNAASGDKGDSSNVSNDSAPETVDYATYKKVLDQRKADQAKARDLQAQLDASNAEKSEREATQLAEQKRFQELYENEKKKSATLTTQLSELTAKQVSDRKREAVRTALGGVRKDDYTKFFDLGAVAMNDDGTPEAESVKSAANKFRESYPELVSTTQSRTHSSAAPQDKKPTAARTLDQLKPNELLAQLAARNTKA